MLFEQRMAVSETELIAKAQAGDVDAFCALVSMHQRAIYSAAFRFCENHYDAEDLTQETFISAHRAIGQFKGLSSFHTWLRKIMLNAFLNGRRKHKPRDPRDISENYELHSAGSDKAAWNNVIVQQVLQRLQVVPERSRLMFIMKHQEGLTCEEIAEHFGTTTGTVKKTLFRLMALLREEFRTPAPCNK